MRKRILFDKLTSNSQFDLLGVKIKRNFSNYFYYCLYFPFRAAGIACIGVVIIRVIQALTPAINTYAIAAIVDSVQNITQGVETGKFAVPFLILFLLILFQFFGNTLQDIFFTDIRVKIKEKYDQQILTKISRLPYESIPGRILCDILCLSSRAQGMLLRTMDKV